MTIECLELILSLLVNVGSHAIFDEAHFLHYNLELVLIQVDQRLGRPVKIVYCFLYLLVQSINLNLLLLIQFRVGGLLESATLLFRYLLISLVTKIKRFLRCPIRLANRLLARLVHEI